MENRTVSRPWHLWAVGVVSALWNAGGAYDYTMTKTHNAAYLSAMTPEQLAWVNGFPAWTTIPWALGVWGAAAGSILLLFASRFAVHAFAVSLAGLVVMTLYQYCVGDMPASLKTSGGMLFTAALWIVAIALLWYAVTMRKRGVLR